MNDENLKPITSKSRARELGRLGGIASQKAAKQKKQMAELAATMLEQSLQGKARQQVEALFPDTDATYAASVVAGQIQAATKGSTKAFVALSELQQRAEASENRTAEYELSPLDITSDFVEPYRLARKILDGKSSVRQIIHRGGRGGGKSSFWAEFAYETIKRNPQANVVFTRRYSSDREHTIFENFCRVIARHNDVEEWSVTKSPMKATYTPTGTSVYFFGSDNPLSNKSFTPQTGYVALLIAEECDEMAGVEQMDDAENTYLRANGVDNAHALAVKIFNPPASKNNFMNVYCEEMRNDETTKIFDACYKNVPVEWLGKRFFERAAWFELHKPEIYKNKFLGEVTGTGGEIFSNVEERTLTDEDIINLEERGIVWQGLDFGYEHPMAFIRVAFDRETDELTVIYEKVQRHAKLSDFMPEEYIGQEVICDSAEPDRIAELQDWGWKAVGAVKRWHGNRGRAYSWEWLRQRKKIIIDTDRTPHMADELRKAEFERLRGGEYSSRYPDVHEDCIMACIYGLNREIMAASEYDF